jgi:hypothetical protein
MAINIGSMCNLATLRVGALIAQMGLDATVALSSDVRLHDAAKRDLDEAKMLLEYAEVDAALELEAQMFWEDQDAIDRAEAVEEAAWREYRDTHTWQQHVALLHPGDNARDRASSAINLAIDAGRAAEFWYSVSEGEIAPQEDLQRLEGEARELMMAALSLLPDADAEVAIEGNKDRDFDNTEFTVTSIDEVRAWRANKAHLTISGRSLH